MARAQISNAGVYTVGDGTNSYWDDVTDVRRGFIRSLYSGGIGARTTTENVQRREHSTPFCFQLVGFGGLDSEC